MSLSDHLKADLLLVAVTLLAAIGWIFSKEALNGLPPLLFVGIRFLMAGLVLVPFGFAQLKALPRADWRRASGVGVAFAAGMLCWILGLHHANHIGVGAFLTSLGVVLVPLVTMWFGEKPARSVWLALPLAGAGIASLSLDSALVIGWGETFFMIAAVIFAFFFTLNSRAAGSVPIIALSAIQLVIVGCVALLVSAFTETWNFDQPTAIWGWLLASVLIATSLRFFMQTWAQGLAPASHTAVIMTLEPVWTALLAMVWFAESMTLMQLAGCGLIFSALLVSRWKAVVMWLGKR